MKYSLAIALLLSSTSAINSKASVDLLQSTKA